MPMCIVRVCVCVKNREDDVGVECLWALCRPPHSIRAKFLWCRCHGTALTLMKKGTKEVVAAGASNSQSLLMLQLWHTLVPHNDSASL